MFFEKHLRISNPVVTFMGTVSAELDAFRIQFQKGCFAVSTVGVIAGVTAVWRHCIHRETRIDNADCFGLH
jgi:hypothetical protein